MAYPVVPPKDRPIDQTKKATGTAPIDPRPIISCVSFIVAFEKFKMVKIKTKVPSISLIKLLVTFLIAGDVQNTFFLIVHLWWSQNVFDKLAKLKRPQS